VRRRFLAVLLVGAGLIAALRSEKPPIETRLADPECTPGMYVAMACDPARYPHQ